MEEVYDRSTNISTTSFYDRTEVFMKKRLTKDLHALYSIDLLYIDSIFTNESQNITISVIDFKYSSYNIYTFNLCGYPFRPPIISIDGIKYRDFLQIGSSLYFRETLKKIINVDCLCCNSCISSNKWCPLSNLSEIINEIRTVRKYRKDAINIFLAYKIKSKYLIDDIDLTSWLV